jgi:peptidoglycan lytic transglycosylase
MPQKNHNYFFTFLILIPLFTSCTIDRSLRSSSRVENQDWRAGRSTNYISGISSYYGKKFHGRKTANGEIFDMNGLTAAHKTLPFGTVLEVENLANNKKVRVRINDRGPFVRNRILDLSYEAAKRIGMLKTGTAKIIGKIIYTPKIKK